ncbi:cytochrome c biogenesis protein CcdA [Bacillus sp. RC206]
MLFILGKIIAFTTLGLLVWFLGKEIQQILTLYFPWLRKIIGPLLILMGLMLAGIIKGRSFFSIKFIRKQNEVASFLLGFSFP